MKIACLQFAPELGKVSENIVRADQVLSEARLSPGDVDLLVLPELAFSGYNHTYESIQPYLELRSSGPTLNWASNTARALNVTVIVGYPELCVPTTTSPSSTEIIQSCPLTVDPFDDQKPHNHTYAYNSTMTVNPAGEIVSHYRKTFLYYTDARWACAGDAFHAGHLTLTTAKMKITHGICMDINPRNFTAPWSEYEFAAHTVASGADMAVISMAWLTLESPVGKGRGDEVDKADALTEEQVIKRMVAERAARQPDLNTLAYWVERFAPCVGIKPEQLEVGDGEVDGDGSGDLNDVKKDESPQNGVRASKAKKPMILVMANRSGAEDDVRYAGTSTIMKVQGDGQVGIWDILGKGEERCLVVDTEKEPKFALR